MQTGIPTAAQVDEALRRTYARPELAPREPGALDGLRAWWRQFWARVGDWFDQFGNLRDASPLVYWAVIGTLVAAGLAIIGYLLWSTLLRMEARDLPDRSREARPGPGSTNARARSAAEWEEEARRAAAAGRYREAAVALYQALLLRLEAAGAVRYDPAKTPGDYRREVRRDPDAAGALTAFLRGFEPAVFGGRALDGEGYERLRAAAAGANGRG
ncbi:DUF4129 domain-containing protein [Longimicrobium sp.]|uniref:DUF4129 domain-containing protein n=1 Tax=Longimicrobium sp. TaxID=2029185 RepID=UPI003B3B143C